VEVLQRTIRGMQIAKLNILHLHITDSESFPWQLVDYAQITKYGAYNSEEVYLDEDLFELVNYAQDRGVLIVPEIDQPAHTRSWALAPELQELNACYGYPP
jgi:hexosaminidase